MKPLLQKAVSSYGACPSQGRIWFPSVLSEFWYKALWSTCPGAHQTEVETVTLTATLRLWVAAWESLHYYSCSTKERHKTGIAPWP